MEYLRQRKTDDCRGRKRDSYSGRRGEGLFLGRERLNIGFWNGEKLWNKEKNTGILESTGLTKTWVKEEDQEKLRKRLHKEFEWKCMPTIKEKKENRAKGGIIVSTNNKLKRREIVKWNN